MEATIVAVGTTIAAIIAAVVAGLKTRHAANLEAEKSKQLAKAAEDKDTIKEWREIARQKDADRAADRKQRDEDRADLIARVDRLQKEHLNCSIELATLKTQMHDAQRRLEQQEAEIKSLETGRTP